MKLSIRWKILLFIIVPIVGIYLSVMTFNIFKMRQWTTNNMEQRMTELVSRNIGTNLEPTAKLYGPNLILTKVIVKSHGGNISVYGEPEKGSVFNVFLPAVKEKAELKKLMGIPFSRYANIVSQFV